MYKILCTAEFDDQISEKFQHISQFDRVGFSIDKDPAKRMNLEEIISALQGYDVHISGYEKITDEVIKNCADLKLILSVRDGPEENIDIDACTKAGIPVLFSSGRCERSVPEFTFLAMMTLAKPIREASGLLRQERWSQANDLRIRRICEQSTELYGKTIGIIGLGRNGHGLACRCTAFGMKVLAYDPYISAETAASCGAIMTSLEELMSTSDYVSVLARVTPSTIGIVTRELIYSMKPGACLINTARAALVDNEALLEALTDGRIRAALDVYTKEPLPVDSPLYNIPESRLLLTPHLAGLSLERIVYQSEKLYDAYDRYTRGELIRNIKNPEVMQTEAFRQKDTGLFGYRR